MACAGVESFYGNYFGKPTKVVPAAGALLSDASAADRSDPTDYHQLAVDVSNWLTDVSAVGWAQNGNPGDRQTNAVSNDCTSLLNKGLVH